ncbi:MAG TPA: twin-arginine translocation signal domain-containing protein [Candidatus Dormibacteraeota bacterium]
MKQVSRRTFLRQASLGAAAVGVATTVPSFLRPGGQGGAKATPAAQLGKVSHDGPLVAHIDDVNTGEITVMVGTRQVTYRNDEVARGLLRATE